MTLLPYIHFQYPWALTLLLVIPVLAMVEKRKSKKAFFGYSDLSKVPRPSKLKSLIGANAVTIFRLTSIFFLVAGLSRPKLDMDKRPIEKEGIDILLAIDTSASMQALDFEMGSERYDRLTVAKRVIADFIAQRADDRIGIVIFGSKSFTQVPLTLDHEVLLSFLEHLEIGMAGRATAIGDAIAVSAKRLESSTAKSKIIILLTDGSNTAGAIDPATATEAAKNLGYKVYSIAIGSKGKVPFPVDGIFGKTIQYQTVDMDEDLLKQIASTTGGKYFLASNTSMLKDVYTTIDKLEKTKIKSVDYSKFRDLYPTLISLALVFCVGEYLLRVSKFLVIP
ncbi:MAG: VWA domain-containing protein [Oligoflexales bacterium]